LAGQVRLTERLTLGVWRSTSGVLAHPLAESTIAAGNQATASFVLACEDKDLIALADVISTVHRLLRRESPGRCALVRDVGLDREDGFGDSVRMRFRDTCQ
jgi:hypothetical protein